MLPRIWKNYVTSDSGALLPVVALLFPVLLGFGGLGVDAGFWMMEKRSMQTVADAASLAAAFEYSHGENSEYKLTAVALREAVANGYTAKAGSTFTVDVLADDRIQVDIRQPITSFFASYFISGDVAASVTAIAEAAGDTTAPCMLSLSDSASEAIITNSNAAINMAPAINADGCGIHANSTSPSSIVTDSNSEINAASICTVGGYVQKSNSTTSVPVQEGCAKVDDPFAALEPPAVGACDHTNKQVSSDTTLQPGVYCGGLVIDTNTAVTFAPGTYIIKDGQLTMNSNSTAIGTGVTFYFTGASATLNLKSNTTATLSAPGAGPMAGILFFQNPADSGTHTMNSNVSGGLDGLMYFPNGNWESNSNSTITATGKCTQLVAQKIKFDSNSGMTGTPDFANCPNYANYPVGGPSQVRLVQ